MSTTSTYWVVDVVGELADLAETVDDDGVTRPVEQAARALGHSRDHRADLLTELRKVFAEVSG